MSAGAAETDARPGRGEAAPLADDPLENAFELAYFVHANRATALRIASAALGKLSIAVAAQDKRLYYQAVGSRGPASKAARFRRKVSLGDSQLLQRLVYIESETYERQRECMAAEGAPAAEDMLVFFVKHLVQITVKRNAFYVALGVDRVLHDYSTQEAMTLYEALLEASEPGKGEDYFRARKARLMREIQARFGDTLRVVRGVHGEERFETHEDNRYGELLRECLERFTPWGTVCSRVGERDEHQREIGRMHAILHPFCHLREAERLRLDKPEERLRAPRFAVSSRGDGGSRPTGGRGRPAPLTSEERLAVDQELAELSARRKRSSAGLLRIEVDKRVVGFLDVERERVIRFEVDENAELVEIVDPKEAGGTALAACVLPLQNGKTGATRVAITLEGGQSFSFDIRRPGFVPDDNAMVVEIRYAPRSRVSSLFGALERRVGAMRWKPALAFALLVALGAGIALFRRSRELPVATRPVTATPAPRPTDPARLTPDGRLASGEVGKERRGRATSHEGETVTRDVPPPSDVKPLQRVRKIAIEMTGGDDVGKELEGRLLATLASKGILIVTAGRDGADALLQITIPPGGDVTFARVELLDPDGRTLWPPAETHRRGYRGGAGEIGERIARDLEGAILGSHD